MNSITFFGAAGSVTGSKHLVEIGGKKILFDCGTFQGLSDVRERNRSFPFPPDSIDAVVISHAHLDHIGMLPLLVRRGYAGSIYSTPATKDVAAYILEDSVGIEIQDASYRKRHHIGAPDEREPMLSQEDVVAALDRFVTYPYAREDETWHEILPGIQIRFYDAGHILGSSIIVLRYTEDGAVKHIAYTGDVGPKGMPLLHDPEIPKEEIHTLLMESTYGNRTHLPLSDAEDRLAEAIVSVCERKGAIIVPAFSLGRTQMLIYTIHKLTDEKRIPRFPIFVDSPLATDITSIYRKYRRDYDEQTALDFTREGDAPLAFRNLQYTHSVEESKQLNGRQGPFMVISASGMMTAGRVVHHLRNTISDPKNAVFVTGYQAAGTTGRKILRGEKNIELMGEFFPIRAEIFLFNEFSAHADAPQLTDLANSISGLQTIALVHGEPKESEALEGILRNKNQGWNIVRPNEGETISI